MNVCFFVLFCFVLVLFIYLFLFFLLCLFDYFVHRSLFPCPASSRWDVYKIFNPLKSLIYFYLRSFADLNHAKLSPFLRFPPLNLRRKMFCISISLFSDAKMQKAIDFVAFKAEVVNFVLHCSTSISNSFNFILIQAFELGYSFFLRIRCY